MNMESFARAHRLKVRMDGCGDRVIPGRVGEIAAYDSKRLQVIYMPDPQGRYPLRPVRWTNRKAKLSAAGCEIHQDCDGEGSALFDPGDQAQARVAITVAGIKRKREASPAQLAVLARARRLSPLCAEAS